jgi:DNA-binding winged helix-turn-helix (wHTH) protein
MDAGGEHHSQGEANAMAAQVYVFESFRLDVQERQLRRNGSVIHLRGKVFDTLCALVRHPGRLLRKSELMKAVWPDTVVEENNLEHNLCVLRKILGQNKKSNKFIETVPRQGYRFVAMVNALDETVATPAGHSSPKAFDTGYSEARGGLPVTHVGEPESEGVVYWGLA